MSTPERLKLLKTLVRDNVTPVPSDIKWLVKIADQVCRYRDMEDDHEHKYGRSDASHDRLEKKAHEIDRLLHSID